MLLLQGHIAVSVALFLGVSAIMFFGTIGFMTYFNYKSKEDGKRPLSIAPRINNFGKGLGVSVVLSVLFVIILMVLLSIRRYLF